MPGSMLLMVNERVGSRGQLIRLRGGCFELKYSRLALRIGNVILPVHVI